MRFDSEYERWCVELQGRGYGLYCGESMEIYIGGDPFPILIGKESPMARDLEGCSLLFASIKYMVSI